MLTNYDIFNTKYPRLLLLCEFLAHLFVSSSKYVCVKKRSGSCICRRVVMSGALTLILDFSSARLQLITGQESSPGALHS